MQFSLATTVFNNQDEIIEFLKNIENQVLRPSEIIIADGGSKDDTVKVIEEYKLTSEIPIVILSGKRLNISEGFNAAIKAAKCELVAVGAVGNRYPENYFECMVRCFEQNGDAEVVCTNLKGLRTTEFSSLYCDMTFPQGKKSITGNHGIMVKKSVFEEIGCFYEKFVYAGEDEEFLQRVVNKGKKLYLIEDLFADWDVPHTYKEFDKQNSAYILAVMQIYTNDLVFSFYKKNIFYVVLIFATLVMLFIPYIQILGGVLLLGLIAMNMKTVLKKGFRGCIFRNSQYFLTVKYLIKHRKFLKEENKIDKEYRLDSHKSVTKFCEFIKMNSDKGVD